jgi:hypothetical protein
VEDRQGAHYVSEPPEAHTCSLLKIFKAVTVHGPAVLHAVRANLLRIPARLWAPILPSLLGHIFQREAAEAEARAAGHENMQSIPSTPDAAGPLAELVLLRLAKDFPDTVLIPVVVESRAHAGQYPKARTVLGATLAMIRGVHPRGSSRIAAVESLVQELDRVTVLW